MSVSLNLAKRIETSYALEVVGNGTNESRKENWNRTTSSSSGRFSKRISQRELKQIFKRGIISDSRESRKENWNLMSRRCKYTPRRESRKENWNTPSPVPPAVNRFRESRKENWNIYLRVCPLASSHQNLAKRIETWCPRSKDRWPPFVNLAKRIETDEGRAPALARICGISQRELKLNLFNRILASWWRISQRELKHVSNGLL